MNLRTCFHITTPSTTASKIPCDKHLRRISDTSLTRILHIPLILAQCPPLHTRLRNPPLPPLHQLTLTNIQVQKPLPRINRDCISVFDDSNGHTFRGFGDDMADQEVMRAAGKSDRW